MSCGRRWPACAPSSTWPSSPVNNRILADLLAEVDRLTRLAGDLLILARVDDAEPPPVEPVDIAALAARTAERYAAARVPVTVHTRPTSTLEVNATALGRVLTNVLDNAVRHAGAGVELSGRNPPRMGASWSRFPTMGPGIPAGDRLRVFERFTRLDDARDRDSGGSGLGLAIAAELIRQQGGTIALADAEIDHNPPGLRVEVRLPPAPAAV